MARVNEVTMQLLFEILPVALFFFAFKLYDIYVATVVGILATFTLMMVTRLTTKKWDRKQVITFFIFVFFGGLTLYFHDPIFVKWKPTIVFWVFAIVTIGSQFVTKRPLIQRLMEHMFENKVIVPFNIWRKLNFIWAAYFFALGALNLYVAYYLSNDAWVNFKFYGITSALILLSIVQSVYLMRYDR